MATFPSSQSGIAFAVPNAITLAGDRDSARIRRDSIEFWIAFLLIALATWTPPLLQAVFALAAIVWVTFTTIRSFNGARSTATRLLGLRLVGFRRSAWVLAAATGLAAAAIAIAAHLGTLHVPPTPALILLRYSGYAVWSFMQEFLLLNYVLPRLMRLMPTKHLASLAAGSLFAFVHLPNPVLTPLTALWGYLSCLIFLHYRNLYVPAFTHALLGITIALTVPGPIDHNMRVGLGYLTYGEHRRHHPALVESGAARTAKL
jgi:hypothetical protein